MILKIILILIAIILSPFILMLWAKAVALGWKRGIEIFNNNKSTKDE